MGRNGYSDILFHDKINGVEKMRYTSEKRKCMYCNSFFMIDCKSVKKFCCKSCCDKYNTKKKQFTKKERMEIFKRMEVFFNEIQL